MNKISLDKTIPQIFSDAGTLSSGIWGINTHFDKGNFYLIKANSGKGKSSLCSYIYGYRNDYQGQFLFDNVDIQTFSPLDWDRIRQSEISYLFQDLLLFPELTALENIILKNKQTHFKTLKQILEMLDYLDIEQKANTLCAKMSLGQQQRVAAIRCLCQPFSFLLADEPISHLDDANAKRLANLMEKEAKQQGAGLIVTSIGQDLPLEYQYEITL